MSKYLVIVESPTKARTIGSILGKDYEVASTMGHVVDLPYNKLSVDVDNDFQPKYRTLPDKEKIITQLKKKAKEKRVVYLATDPDREGEAISWHIKEKLTIKKQKYKFKRVVFHEITEEALSHAFRRVSNLDMRKVNAQIARRVLDRIVGYRLSPLLWKRIIRGLSAGRVQSIALRFIVEREKQISAFIPQTTYSINAKFRSGDHRFVAKLNKYRGKKGIFESKGDALKCIEKIKEQAFLVKGLTKKEIKRKPPPPYITSSVQQDAFNRLRFSAQRTMVVAQKLYEGITVAEKSVGLITYMRTDSFHISPKAKKEAKQFIQESFGQDYLTTHEYHYKKKKGAQLAHEAIRPTSVNRLPREMDKFLAPDENKLYDLIWRRFVAVFMKEALFESQKAIIKSKDCEFVADGKKIIFKGYLKAYGDSSEDNPLPPLEAGQDVKLEGLEVAEHTTKPPARYNDASLVKILEDRGIGRPSTYAPTIYTLIKRHYIRREQRAFIPSELGIKVSDLLVASFPQIINEEFTAVMEDKLDLVEKGDMEWNKVLRDFYPLFNEKVEKILSTVKKEVEYSDKNCQKCKGRMVIKWSRRGKFLSCEHFPKCKYAESITSGVACPDCKDGSLIQRRNKRGQLFYGCSNFPNCRYTSRNLPQDSNCDDNSLENNETE